MDFSASEHTATIQKAQSHARKQFLHSRVPSVSPLNVVSNCAHVTRFTWNAIGRHSGGIRTKRSCSLLIGSPALIRRIRCAALWEVFATEDTANPSEVGVLFSTFFQELNLAVIDTVMGHVNVHMDCHLISCYESLYRAS